MTASPWVWFDVDDVLVDSTPLFQESMDRWTGRHVPWESWPHNHFPDFYGIQSHDTEAIAQMKAIWKKDRVLERAPLRSGVEEALQRIHDLGYPMGLITARGWHEEGAQITQDLADRHRLPVQKIISMDYSQTKADFLQAHGAEIVAFVDDTPRHVEGCVQAGLAAFLLHHSWNATAVHLPRIHHLQELADQLSSRSRAKLALWPDFNGANGRTSGSRLR